jgi:hypothetical protein
MMRLVELKMEADTGIELVNPFYDTQRIYTANIDNGLHGKYDNLNFKTLVDLDLQHIADCDGVLAYVPDDVFLFGTACECWYALNEGMVVHIVSPSHSDHPWVKYITYFSTGHRFKDFRAFQRWVEKEEVGA